jgi:hypothetical protein
MATGTAGKAAEADQVFHWSSFSLARVGVVGVAIHRLEEVSDSPHCRVDCTKTDDSAAKNISDDERKDNDAPILCPPRVGYSRSAWL